ncbi:MAG: gliding motility-associated ABC transporter substrate-binding protein GldG [Bacteroides sp.]|nr:gliding motility-associated ABC transporter substrate-binding protein GldG [Bacteroides sp.]
MRSLLNKEIRLFFSGPLAYLVLAVFFAANALMLFVLPTSYNIFDAGYASLDAFFSWAPLVFLFLVPALCMRSFAEEKKSGTMEMLLTRPLTRLQLVAAKFLAGFLLLAVSLLPVFLYLYTVSNLASPQGNFDLGAFWGTLTGLLLLGAAFVAVCVFMSSLTQNQVVAFILSVAACTLLYVGFDLFAALIPEGGLSLFVAKLGISQHYSALSRGVVDFRDVAYYLSLVVLFSGLTVLGLDKRRQTFWRRYALAAALLVLVDVLAAALPFRLDLTADRRYTLMPVTKNILKQDNTPVYVKVYLTGSLPAGFKRLERSVRETLDEFRIYRPSIRYTFTDIYAIEGEEQRQALMQELAQKGISPTQLEVKTRQGLTRRLIFPAAELRCGGRSVAVGLLSEQLGRGAEETLNNSIENVELQLANAIRALTEKEAAGIAFLEGNGELTYSQTVSFGNALSSFYRVTRAALSGDPASLLRQDSAGNWHPRFAAAVVAHPTKAFTEAQKAVIDQYVMHGGKVLWVMDAGNGSLDSLKGQSLFDAMPYHLNLEDLFFRYGFRLRNEMLLDRNAAPSPVLTGYMGNQPMIEFMPNYYCPLVETEPGNMGDAACMAQETGSIRLQVAAGIDTIENALKKTPLLQTSSYSFRVRLPHAMSADLMRNPPDLRRFDQGRQTVALLLEGSFQTAYPLVKPELENAPGFNYLKQSGPSAMMVVGDGDMARNDILPDGQPLPLGFDRYTRQMYGNGNFLVNAVHYLAGNREWIKLKPREVRLRLLDKAALEKQKKRYTVLNFALPIGAVLVFGLLFTVLRKKRFAVGTHE